MRERENSGESATSAEIPAAQLVYLRKIRAGS
jgi:hypothetical protein